MQVLVLGPLEARVDGREIALGAAKQRAVLAILALHANSAVSIDELMEGLWGEHPPSSAPKMVQQYVSQLRRTLADGDAGEATILTRGRGYELRIPPDDVDAARFARLVSHGSPRQALSLWRGGALDDIADEPFAAAEIRRLQELRLDALEQAIDADLDRGLHRELIVELEVLTSENPLSERLHGQLMVALYRSGRQAEALEAYRRARRRLVEEIGIEPGPELQRLHEAILRQDVSLDAPPAREVPKELDATSEPPVGTITLLFTDIEGSTRVARETGAAWRDVRAVHHEAIARAIERHGGYVDGAEGDAFFATFADARAAVDAALDAQSALAAAPWPRRVEPLRVRMGVHTGYVERTELGYVGLEVHRAARVGAAARGGQILVTSATRELLRDDTDVEDLGEHRLKDFPRPQRLFHVVRDGRHAAEFGPLLTAEARPTNLPEDLMPLVGRDRELDHLQELLTNGIRFVTLIGAGGAGKTRLALALARRLLDDLPGGAFVVPLAPVSDPAGVLPAIARALELGDDAGDLARRVADRLSEPRSLLVLDNFEQITTGGPLVVELLERARDLRVLVTSQAPLHVRGETVVALDALAAEDAMALFIDRACAAAPGWSASGDDTAAIAEVCERVGRLPLAVELAAARTVVLSPRELLHRLEASSDVLRNVALDAPQRHRSLRATFEWSYGLLAPEQQALFSGFGAFAGPVPLDAVEAVATGDVLEALEALVDFSLVRRVESPAHGFRFTMPQALRDFARDKSAASSAHDAVRRRHAEHVLAVARESRVWYAAAEAQRRRLLAIDTEIRLALGWAAEHDAELYRRLVAELGLGLVRRGHVGELIEYAERAEQRLDATGAWIINCHAYALLMAGRFQEAETTIAPAITWAREAGSPRELGLVLHTLAWILDAEGKEPSVAVARESLELLRATGDRGLEKRGIAALVQTLVDQGHLEEAKAAQAAAGDLIDVQSRAITLGDIALLEGKPAEAIPQYARSLQFASRAGDGIQIANDCVCVAVGLLRAGFIEAGMEAAGAIAALAAETGHGGFDSYRESLGYAATFQAARAERGTDAAFRRGQQLDPARRVPRILELAREANAGTAAAGAPS